MMKAALGILAVCIVVAKETQSAEVNVERKEILVLPGQNATFLCRVAVPLQYCRIEIPGFTTKNLNKGKADGDVSYFGEGLDAGQCGVTINRVEDKNNGPVKCMLGIASESAESIGHMKLIVAKPPKVPVLDLSRDSLNVYKINDVLEASCIVRDGRPVANITWYLNDELINDADLKMATVIDLAKENLQSKLQNLTRTLQATDNGKYLRCVAFHPAYPRGFEETQRQLDVKYSPLPIHESLDKFNLQLGSVGFINVTFESNPKSRIEWNIGGQTVREGSTDNTGRIEAEALRELGRGIFVANLRIARIEKQDTEQDYVLTAYNDLGSQEYRFRISTSPEPEAVEIGFGAIIGIVVSILFVILLVSILIFAKVTGRWCFSGFRDARNLGECSDTESADVRPREMKKSLTPVKLTALFRKNKDKVSSEEEPETRRIDVDETPIKSKEREAENLESKTEDSKEKEGLVYAELDLVRADMKPVVKNDDEKTEYAEIVYTPSPSENEAEEGEKQKDERNSS